MKDEVINMENFKITDLYNLDETIAKKIFDGCTYPWEVLPKIKNFIIKTKENEA